MNTPPLLSAAEVETLLSQSSISDRRPWCTNDELVIDGFYRKVCVAVSEATGALSRIEWDHYGSGYASYVDAWFYTDNSDFDVTTALDEVKVHVGLMVLLSRQSPYFVFMEGRAYGDWQNGGGGLPNFNMVDQLSSPGVVRLALQVQPVLESHGLIRASREDLQTPLPPTTHVPTVLTDPPHTQFDALYYWQDY